jgi:hypothetical protein
MHEIDKMWKIENSKIKSHTIQKMKQRFSLGVFALFFWYGNNASTKQKALTIELLETYGLIGYYRTLTPCIMLSNFPLPVFMWLGI